MTSSGTKSVKLTTDEKDEGIRLDVFLSTVAANADDETAMAGLTRSTIKKLIKDGLVLLDDKTVSPSKKLHPGGTIKLVIPKPAPLQVKAEAIDIEILYEDKDIIVINKPQGLTVHPGAGRASGTLVNALLNHTSELSSIGGPLRPGIVHRLDKDTSGVLVVAKNNPAHLRLSKQFKEHTTTRQYHGVLWGVVSKDEGSVEARIGRDMRDRKKISLRTRRGKKAVTNYRVLKRYGHFSLVELSLETGRTHQIRVHMASIKHPVVGDPLYGKRPLPSSIHKELSDSLKGLKGQLLHAKSLGFNHPRSGEYIEFNAPYPKQMNDFLQWLERDV